jgi:hypothetical protein
MDFGFHNIGIKFGFKRRLTSCFREQRWATLFSATDFTILIQRSSEDPHLNPTVPSNSPEKY